MARVQSSAVPWARTFLSSGVRSAVASCQAFSSSVSRVIGSVAVDSIVAGQRGNGGQSSEPLRWQISACSASRVAPMVDRAALPISRQRAQNPMGNRTRVIRSVAVDSIVAGRGSAPLSVLPDDHAILANLGVPVLLRKGEAEVPGAVGVGGLILPGSGGADNVKAVHSVRFVWYGSILQHGRGASLPPVCHLGVWHQGDRGAGINRQQGGIQGGDAAGQVRSGEDARELRTQVQQFGAPGDQRQADFRSVQGGRHRGVV